jgi:Bacterial regulatory protein, Fis family
VIAADRTTRQVVLVDRVAHIRVKETYVMNVVASPIEPYASAGEPLREWTEDWGPNGTFRTTIEDHRASAARSEAFAALLRALSTVLDIREVFPRISRIAANVLPHDLLTFHDPNGEVVIEATSTETGMRGARLKRGDLGAVERDMIARVLRDSGVNKSRAARRLGLSRTQLYGRLSKFQLDR